MYEDFKVIEGPAGYAALWWVDDVNLLPQNHPSYAVAHGWVLNVRRDGTFDFRSNGSFDKRIGQDEWYARRSMRGPIPTWSPARGVVGTVGRDGTVHSDGIGLLEMRDAAMLVAMAARMAELGGIP